MFFQYVPHIFQLLDIIPQIFHSFCHGFCHAQVCGSKSGLQKLSGVAERSRLLAATQDFPIELKHIPSGYLT